ncbi:hypothetical protein HK102_003443 [Quaeritorhiza haematococci]|nr:hypothetical protein HK102_003443 [Quaeritorhiza haematococci]
MRSIFEADAYRNRFGHPLQWDLDGSKLVVHVFDALYSRTLGGRQAPTAVDPSGGPMLGIGQIIRLKNRTFEITEIIHIEDSDASHLVYTFRIKPMDGYKWDGVVDLATTYF